jgi:hypothetical protein
MIFNTKIKSMIRIISYTFLLLVSLLAKAQITENRTVGNFTKIKVSQGIDVFFTQGEWKPLRIETENQENINYLKTEVEGNTLKLFIDADNVSKGMSTKQKKKKNGYNWINFESMKVFVTAPHVTDFVASSSGSIQFENIIQNDNISLKASSSGSISGDIICKNVAMEASSSGDITSKLKADKVEADVSSSGEVILSGRTTTAEIQASSSGDCKAKNLAATNAVIAASSAGSIEITVLESLDAKASSSSDIWYYGNPTKVAKDTSSSGSITKK